MRVLHVVPAVAARYGGPSRAALEMSRALGALGVEVMVATTDADGPGRLPVEVGRPVSDEGVPTVFFRRHFGEGYKYSRGLACWLRESVAGFDVVHVHAVFSHACLAAGAACRRRGVPYVVRPLGTLDPWSLRQRRWRKRLLWRLAAARMLRGAAAVHYTTEEERRLAEEGLGLTRGVVVPLGVPDELLAPGGDTGAFRRRHPALGEDPYVLALCRLHEKKRVDLLVEALCELSRRSAFGRWRLVVAGDGEPGYVRALRALAERAGGRDRVLFTGWLAGVDRIDALRGAALLALPSHQENFALSAVEALACAVPVLVSARVNLADDIREVGCGWVADLDEAPLLPTLEAALRDAGERARRGQAGRELVRRRFAWPAVAARLLGLYESLADRDRRASGDPAAPAERTRAG